MVESVVFVEKLAKSEEWVRCSSERVGVGQAGTHQRPLAEWRALSTSSKAPRQTPMSTKIQG